MELQKPFRDIPDYGLLLSNRAYYQKIDGEASPLASSGTSKSFGASKLVTEVTEEEIPSNLKPYITTPSFHDEDFDGEMCE